MDEILIDEKKYISSKQAAKLTGYAKDYVGQLCREGRVPARLVGRSWYVLESAIQDHRFGPGNEDSREVTGALAPPALPWTKQSPHYETPSDEFTAILPPVKSKKPDPVDTRTEDTTSQEPESLQSSWKAWFDRVGETIESVMPSAPEQVTTPPVPEFEATEAADEPTQDAEREVAAEEAEVNIPIHTIYEAPIEKRSVERESAVEIQTLEETTNKPPTVQKEVLRKGRSNRLVQTLLVAIALLVIGVTILNTGYLDRYVVSVNQASVITGVNLYNK
jgi:hypothetical protein